MIECSTGHVVSEDWVHWKWLKPAVPIDPLHGVAWDGSVTLGLPGGPVLLFDSPPEPSHVNVARVRTRQLTGGPLPRAEGIDLVGQ